MARIEIKLLRPEDVSVNWESMGVVVPQKKKNAPKRRLVKAESIEYIEEVSATRFKVKFEWDEEIHVALGEYEKVKKEIEAAEEYRKIDEDLSDDEDQSN